ncbi:pectin esterase [Candidatus Sumerlaeota bacterium]|nr:pectin esterase [Candidatus Sumerlaeota bacterium]
MKRHCVLLSLIPLGLAAGCAMIGGAGDSGGSSSPSLAADIVVAPDGSGDFTTVQAAVESIPKDNAERIVVLVRNGVYNEKIRIDASRVTLRGESRKGTRIEYSQLASDFSKNEDDIGRGVVNIEGDDAILENLTVENTQPEVGPHAFAVFGRGDRTVIVDCDVLSLGADTVSLWRHGGGVYYHANCSFKGAVDFVCPRGWCYVVDCDFYETRRGSAAIWHDGQGDEDKKFVLRNCRFDGVEGFALGRRHKDAQFYLLDGTFSERMADKPIFRVTYPTEPHRDAPNLFGDRYYFFNCHGDKGDLPWFADNLSTAKGSPTPDRITAAWTFAGEWNPECADPVGIKCVTREGDLYTMVLEEDATVRGAPALVLESGDRAEYASGSGSDRLVFKAPSSIGGDPRKIDLNGGAVFACQAGRAPRFVVSLP